MNAAEHIETSRLILRRPRLADAQRIFDRYASDREVTKYLAWPRHEDVNQTIAFTEFSDAEWDRWPAGPFLIESRATGELLGGTGLHFETFERVATGYVLARDAWAQGYATEALFALCELAQSLGVRQMYALVHVDQRASQRVLEKCGFQRRAELEDHFPNLAASDDRLAQRGTGESAKSGVAALTLRYEKTL